MWVVRRIKKGNREVFRKKWILSEDDKFVMWTMACFVIVVLIIVVFGVEQ
jgi:hypothetical protein